MPVLDGVKFACKQCIIGHRTGKCNHNDGRELFPIRGRGRPRSQCDTCTERRRTESYHVKCSCGSDPAQAQVQTQGQTQGRTQGKKRSKKDAGDDAAPDAAPPLPAPAPAPVPQAAKADADAGTGAQAAQARTSCSCHLTNVCSCCNSGASRPSATQQVGMPINTMDVLASGPASSEPLAAPPPFGLLPTASFSSREDAAMPPSCHTTAGASSPCCRDPNCICGTDADASRVCCAFNGPEDSPAIVAARQRGFRISTGPQPRRMRKDRLREEEHGINYRGTGRTPASYNKTAAKKRGRNADASPEVDTPQRAEHDSADWSFNRSSALSPPPPLGSGAGAGVEAWPSHQAHVLADDASRYPLTDAVALPPPRFAPEREWYRPPSVFRLASASSSSSSKAPANLGPATPSAPTHSAVSSSSLIPPASPPIPPLFDDSAPSAAAEPKLDALLEVIKSVREGPASIQCSCKGTCRCASCAGRKKKKARAKERGMWHVDPTQAQGRGLGGVQIDEEEEERDELEEEEEVAGLCCGRKKKSRSGGESGSAVLSGSKADATARGSAPAQPQPQPEAMGTAGRRRFRDAEPAVASATGSGPSPEPASKRNKLDDGLHFQYRQPAHAAGGMLAATAMRNSARAGSGAELPTGTQKELTTSKSAAVQYDVGNDHVGSGSGSEDEGGDCDSCGACDLELKMPSGIAAVDDFASAAAAAAAGRC
ncbi:copper-binding transcription factor [Tilletia horrida]|nr:copper-binding transcription factor [Tilletia horrida]